jgi:hypothetical protein
MIVAREISGNVVFIGTGTFNLAGLTTFRDVSLLSGVYPVNTPFPPGFSIGGNSSGSIPADAYGGFPTGPSTFGPGSFRIADLVHGDRFGAGNNLSVREIYVPDQYQSGVMLSGSSTFISETFSSLGVIPGTYVWAWGSGDDADSLTLKIIPIPEPSSVLLLFAGFAAMLVQRCR